MPFEHTASKPEDAPTTVWLLSFRIRNLGTGQDESFAGMHPQSGVEGCWMAKNWCSCISGRPIQCSWQEIGISASEERVSPCRKLLFLPSSEENGPADTETSDSCQQIDGATEAACSKRRFRSGTVRRSFRDGVARATCPERRVRSDVFGATCSERQCRKAHPAHDIARRRIPGDELGTMREAARPRR